MSTTTQRPTPETDAYLEQTKTSPGPNLWASATFTRKLERERDEAREQLEAMREAISEAHADIQSGHELWPVWVGTPTTMQVHQRMQSALRKLQPFLKP